jgi:hypothetical protein
VPVGRFSRCNPATVPERVISFAAHPQLVHSTASLRAETGIYTYGLVSAATSPCHLHEYVGGVNWYLNRLVRITGDYRGVVFEPELWRGYPPHPLPGWRGSGRSILILD